MTRYEMAQIVAKAMAKGANVDKLAAEFADELDALGVRVAALEKKADNVKITGQIRYHWSNGKVDGVHGTNSALRTRLIFTGKVNDNWNYVGRLENRQVFQESAPMADYGGEDNNHTGEDGKTQWQMAYLQGRLGGVNVIAGRYTLSLGHSESDIFTDRLDGINLSYGSKVRLSGYYGKPAHYDWRNRINPANPADNKHDLGYKKGYGVSLEGDLGKNVTLWAGYDKFVANESSFDKNGKVRHTDDNAVWNVGAQFKFNDFSLASTYAKSDDDTALTDHGVYVDLNYKGANKAKPGSWGLQVKYYHWGDGVTLAGQHGWDNLFINGKGGWKGWKFGANYAVAKNMVAEIAYWDMKDLEETNGSKVKSKALWTALNVSF